MLDQGQSYLRLFSNDIELDQLQNNLRNFPLLAQHFESLTGWTVGYRETTASRVRRQNHPGQVLPVSGKFVIDDMSPLLKSSERPLSRVKCESFLASLNHILRELDECRDQIWRQDALLATGIPVSVRSDSTEKLAILLQSLLRSAADAVGCDSAGLYMLDDGTKQLDLRCQMNREDSTSFEPVRELRECKADLEALLGNAVVLEDTANYQQWRIPRSCGSAVCLPISSSNALLGTFWVCAAHPRHYNGAELNVLEIIAGRIATELERFALIQTMQQQVRSDERTNNGPHLPNIPPPIEELRIAGVAKSSDGVPQPGSVYDWAICKQGRLAFMLGHAPEFSGNPGHSATILQTAFRAHSTHCHDAQDLFDAIFETSITVSSGLDPVRFTCGYIEPSTGQIEFAGTDTRVGVLGDAATGRSLLANPTPSGEFGLAHVGRMTLGVDQPVYFQISSLPTESDSHAASESMAPQAERGELVYVDDFHLPGIAKSNSSRTLVSLHLQLKLPQHSSSSVEA